MTHEDKTLAANIDEAKRLRGYTNDDLAERLGRDGLNGRNWVQERTSGRRALTYGQLVELSHALEIPVRVLTGDRTHLLRYLSENPDLLDHASRWIIDSAGELALTG